MAKNMHKKPSGRAGVVLKKPSASKANAFIPRTGLARLIARTRSRRSSTSSSVPYTRSTSKIGTVRRDRIKPTRTMLDFATPNVSPTSILVLKKDGLIRNRDRFDKCEECDGKLAKDKYYAEFRRWSRRCTSRSCRCRYDVLGNHPFFGSPGKGSLSLSVQSTLLCCFLSKLTIAAAHTMTGVPGISIQRFYDKVRIHIASFVKLKQDEILLSDENMWTDVEVDEVTLSKTDDGSDQKPISWVQYLAIIRRGHPASLILVLLPVRSTVRRAPGPGPILKAVWDEIAAKYVKDKGNIVIHTDSARAYRKVIPGTMHTAVVHQVKKVNGVWVQPAFVRTETLELPDFIDGVWRFLRKDSRDSLRHSKPELVEKLVRVSQWRYWTQDQDLYSALSRTMPWAP